jgi:hypothetical protein
MNIWGIVTIILLLFSISGCNEKEYDYQENLSPQYETVQPTTTTSPATTKPPKTTSPPTTPPPVVQSGTCFTSSIVIDGVSYYRGTSIYEKYCGQRATSPPTTTRAPTTTQPPPPPTPPTTSYKKSPPSDIDLSNGFKRTYTWSYGGRDWGMVLNFYNEAYKVYEDRTRQRDYDLFASDPYDDELIKSLADFFMEMGENYNLEDWEIPLLAVSFVQSLPYTSDSVTTGYDEYPRFPYETLYDNGGDCEDTSILAAAILQEMGYGVALIMPPIIWQSV